MYLGSQLRMGNRVCHRELQELGKQTRRLVVLESCWQSLEEFGKMEGDEDEIFADDDDNDDDSMS